eukprot:6588861-Prymnesium_polylepis.1
MCASRPVYGAQEAFRLQVPLGCHPRTPERSAGRTLTGAQEPHLGWTGACSMSDRQRGRTVYCLARP